VRLNEGVIFTCVCSAGNSVLFARKGGVALVLSALKTHADDVAVVEQVCALLRVLAMTGVCVCVCVCMCLVTLRHFIAQAL
jgi:hypothetical protein